MYDTIVTMSCMHFQVEVGNGSHRLFGGAQYHRVLREFAFAIKHMGSPEITEDEIANAAGISDMHDGVNFMRAACVIAVEKARLSFDPLLGKIIISIIRYTDIQTHAYMQMGASEILST